MELVALVFAIWSISNPGSLGGGDGQAAVLDEKRAMVDRVKQVSARALDPAEVDLPLQVWLQRVIQPTTAIEWDVSDCDLKNTKLAHGHPMCVVAYVRRDKLFVKLHILVGSFEVGAVGKPSVHEQSFMGYPRLAAPADVLAGFLPTDSPMVFQSIKSLSELRANLSKISLARIR